MSIKQNITSLQNLLEQANALPDAGGVDLPELTNQAEASELFLNKELIDANGNKVTGTFTIDSELSEQDNLIAQIANALEGKVGSGGVETTTVECNDTQIAPGSEIIYIDGTMALRREELSQSAYIIMKNSIFVTLYYTGVAIEGCSQIAGSISSNCRIFLAAK